jgi:hypothetical protein
MANKKQVFISYHYDTDRHYKNLLLAWDLNEKFDFHMRDHSADVSVNSTDATTIKRVVTKKINEGTYFIVIVGKATKKCEWVKWEIIKAKELKKKIIAIKTKPEHPAPKELYGSGAVWAYSFRPNSINNAISKI